MKRRVALTVLVAGFITATSPVWALYAGNPTFTPNPAYPGQSVSFSGTLPTSPPPSVATSCQVEGPETFTYACTYDAAGDLVGWLVVPADWSSPALPVDVCGPVCVTTIRLQALVIGDAWTLRATLGVTSSPTLVTVPGVRCASLRNAREEMQSAGLEVSASPSDFVVGSQAPPPAMTVSTGTTVSLFPALVPAVTSLPYAEATALVVRACGSPTISGVTSGVVLTQSPSPNDQLPVDRRVLLVLATPTSPPPSSPSSPPSFASSSPPPPPPPPRPPPPSPPHRAWWPLAVTGASLMGVAGAAAGAYQWRIRHHWKVSVGSPGLVLVWEPDVPGRLKPSLIVRRHPTTYRLEDPTWRPRRP